MQQLDHPNQDAWIWGGLGNGAFQVWRGFWVTCLPSVCSFLIFCLWIWLFPKSSHAPSSHYIYEGASGHRFLRTLYSCVRKLTAADVDVEDEYIPHVRAFLKSSSTVDVYCAAIVVVISCSFASSFQDFPSLPPWIFWNIEAKTMKRPSKPPWGWPRGSNAALVLVVLPTRKPRSEVLAWACACQVNSNFEGFIKIFFLKCLIHWWAWFTFCRSVKVWKFGCKLKCSSDLPGAACFNTCHQTSFVMFSPDWRFDILYTDYAVSAEMGKGNQQRTW